MIESPVILTTKPLNTGSFSRKKYALFKLVDYDRDHPGVSLHDALEIDLVDRQAAAWPVLHPEPIMLRLTTRADEGIPAAGQIDLPGRIRFRFRGFLLVLDRNLLFGLRFLVRRYRLGFGRGRFRGNPGSPKRRCFSWPVCWQMGLDLPHLPARPPRPRSRRSFVSAEPPCSVPSRVV